MIRGRFAPSPSGRMHLGNIYAAMISWLSVKSKGGEWLLRIEDLDPQRSKGQYATQAEDDLTWLGLDWDLGGTQRRGNDTISYLQSERTELYERHLQKLQDRQLIYPCFCTRADILATQAPHQADGRMVYNGNCRPQKGQDIKWVNKENRKGATRIIVNDEKIAFCDEHYGPQSVNLALHCGDFILKRADGAFAYQLAVVVDDALMGINEVVRGCDLLLSSAQQIYLYQLLNYPIPSFCHIPLLCNENGQRLCKRDKAMDIEQLRKTHTPEQIIGWLAYAAGQIPKPEEISLKELTQIFSWNKVPTDNICCSFFE